MSLSADGSTIAIGAHSNDGNGSNSGHVRIYQLNSGGNWEQLGGDIDGEVAYDYSGSSVSFSADGSTVAIGAPLNWGNGSSAGHVRIYQRNGESNAWEQVGADIDGESHSDGSGHSVSLSANGSIVAIGATGNDANGSNAGHVSIYQHNSASNAWEQVGADIDGETAGDYSDRVFPFRLRATLSLLVPMATMAMESIPGMCVFTSSMCQHRLSKEISSAPISEMSWMPMVPFNPPFISGNPAAITALTGLI